MPDKLENVKALAVAEEKRPVVIYLHEEELNVARARFVELALLVEEKNQVQEVLRDQHKEEMKPLKEEMGATMGLLKNGYREEVTMCYLVDNQEKGLMEYYTEDGTKVFERRLLPKERQLHLLNSQKKG